MDLIADILLAAGALGAAVYCVVLSRRLSRFTDLQGGVGGAVATLSAQVDEMTRALERARRAGGEQAGTLERSTRRAEEVARRLELLVASLHDLPTDGAAPRRAEAPAPSPAAARPEAPPAPAREIAAEVAPRAAPEPPSPEPAPAWDDWDPFDLAAPPRGVGPTASERAARTPAPERAIGARGGAPVAPPEAPAANERPAATGLPMPIFTAARPGARGGERREGPLTRRITAAE